MMGIMRNRIVGETVHCGRKMELCERQRFLGEKVIMGRKGIMGETTGIVRTLRVIGGMANCWNSPIEVALWETQGITGMTRHHGSERGTVGGT